MTRTIALSKDLPAASNKATPHTLKDFNLTSIPFCQIDNLAPAGSVSSSVNDLSKWVLMQLDEGMSAGKQVIPRKVIRQTRYPHSIMGNGSTIFNKGHFALYGLGVELEEYDGREIVSHTGGVNGFVSSVTMIPEEKLGIVILTNTDQNELFEALKWEIMDAYLGLPYRNYSGVFWKGSQNYLATAKKKDSAWMDSVSLHLRTELPLATYTGSYSNGVYGNMQVVLENGELRMKFSHHPNMYAKLESLGGNRFYATFSDPEFSKAIFPFQVENQQVKSVVVKVADFIEFNPYEFTRN